MMYYLFACVWACTLIARCGSQTTPGGQQRINGGGAGGGNGNDANPMFRNYGASFNPYGNPMNFIPPQAFPPGGAYPGQFPFGQGNVFGGGTPGPYGGYGAPYYGGPYFGGGGGNGGGMGNPYFGGGGGMGGGPYFGGNGMGYAGPFTISGYGQLNPAYGNAQSKGNVPVLNTRLAGGSNSGVRTADGRYAAVSVQSQPDGKPVFRSQTVTGPDSYGHAFAYSSG